MKVRRAQHESEGGAQQENEGETEARVNGESQPLMNKRCGVRAHCSNVLLILMA